jgi:hypothetical protein
MPTGHLRDVLASRVAHNAQRGARVHSPPSEPIASFRHGPRTPPRPESMRASSTVGLLHMHPQQVRWLPSTAGGGIGPRRTAEPNGELLSMWGCRGPVVREPRIVRASSSGQGLRRRERSADRKIRRCAQARDEKADVIFRRVGKQAGKQLAAEGIGITERGWLQNGQRRRERPDAIVDDLSAPFDQAVGEEDQGRSRLKDHLGLRAGAVGSDAERSIRWRLQRADAAIAVNQHRRGMTGVGPAEELRVRVRGCGEPRHDAGRQDAEALGRHGRVNSSEELRGTCHVGDVGSDSAEQTPESVHGPGRRGVVAGDISNDECVPLTLDEGVAPVAANRSGQQCGDPDASRDGWRPTVAWCVAPTTPCAGRCRTACCVAMSRSLRFSRAPSRQEVDRVGG